MFWEKNRKKFALFAKKPYLCTRFERND